MRDGWVEITLEELISHSIGGIWGKEPGNSEIDVSIYRQTEFTDAGILVTPAEAIRSITKNQLNSRTLQFGDILIQKSAGTPSLPGRVVMVESLNGEVASFSNFLNLLRPNITKCLPRIAFLFFWLKHKEGKAFEYQRGTNIKNLDLPSYLQEKVNLPPLAEQKRIVDLISSVDSYIEALQQQVDKARKSRNAVLHELLTKGGHGWVETTIGEISEVVGGGTPSTSRPEYWDGQIVWLTPTEVTSQDGKEIDNSIRKISELGFKNSGAQILPKGSIILTSRASVGFVAIAGTDLCTNQGFQSLIPKESVIAKFLMFWIQQNRSEFDSRSAGSTFKEISKSNVKSMKILLPPLAEQKRIVEIISVFDTQIESLDSTITKTQNLRSALLSDLLSGNHEIPTTYDKLIGAA